MGSIRFRRAEIIAGSPARVLSRRGRASAIQCPWAFASIPVCRGQVGMSASRPAAPGSFAVAD
jgi:hypothetical protein